MNLRLLFTFCLLLSYTAMFGQTSTVFTVGGDLDKFYPILFTDPDWEIDRPTEIKIGRSNVHLNESWRGALMATFVYHTSNWGNGADFIDADIRSSGQAFIAGWTDATGQNGEKKIIVWLKGGNTSYRLNSPANVAFQIYDGQQLPLPYNEPNGPARHAKTMVDGYVKENTKVLTNSVQTLSDLYVNGNVGIGMLSPQEKLSVNGKIRAKEIKVEAENWPDYVFKPGYDKMSLPQIEAFIQANGHLPEVPSAAQAEKEGIALGEMNKILLKKIEELTLHLIEKDKQLIMVEKLQQEVQNLKKQFKHIAKKK